MAFAVLGMRGTGSYAAGERPENWRQAILLLFPSGDAPLTAILSKMRESPTDGKSSRMACRQFSGRSPAAYDPVPRIPKTANAIATYPFTSRS